MKPQIWYCSDCSCDVGEARTDNVMNIQQCSPQYTPQTAMGWECLLLHKQSLYEDNCCGICFITFDSNQFCVDFQNVNHFTDKKSDTRLAFLA